MEDVTSVSDAQSSVHSGPITVLLLSKGVETLFLLLLLFTAFFKAVN